MAAIASREIWLRILRGAKIGWSAKGAITPYNPLRGTSLEVKMDSMPGVGRYESLRSAEAKFRAMVGRADHAQREAFWWDLVRTEDFCAVDFAKTVEADETLAYGLRQRRGS